ncbi:hypothetical protein RUM43_009688 [Polyplax serrata]|uniref:Uncharacterized protein n=1 Tax=Polyplax serrata TaxID=468196 RepID=A0AAN8PJJ8_POLSC
MIQQLTSQFTLISDSNHNGVVSKSGSAVIINNNTSQNNNNNNNHHNVKTANSYQNNKTLKGTTRVSNPVQMKNGSLLAAAKEANKALLRQLKHNVRAFESLAILFSYCANDLDAFSTPQLKQQLETERGKFVQAQSDIEELQSKLIRIREELNDKELIITELSNDKVSLVEESGNFRKLVEELQNKLKIVTEQKCEAETELLKECENIRCLKRELSNRTDKYENEKENLSGCLTEAKRENGILKSANREIREEYNKCLLENQRLVEVISRRQNEKVDKENRDGEEISRTRQKVPERSPERFPITPAASEKSFWNQANNSPIPVNPKCLESEVESLRQVLALKTDEVTELRRQELSLRENADRVPKLLSTITMLEGKVEDLQSQLSSQTETVRDLFKSNEHLEDELKSASIQRTRLTQKNEELQYKLKQYAEAMKQLATQNLSEKTTKPEISPIKANYKKSEGGLEECITPHMKAVVEKSDSVSYMLEMMEDSSEIVTNIIKRAESLRSTNRDQVLGKKRRPKVSSVGSNEATSTKRNLSVEDDFRPGIMSTPNLSPNEYETERHRHHHQNATSSSRQHSYNVNKAVKLSQEDFATDSIDLGNEDCEIIEITKCFYKTDKNGEMVTSTSSSSSSSSNGSHFDIESDVFSNSEDREANIQEVEEYGAEPRENGHSVIRTYRRETENLKPVLPVYKDLDGSEEARTRSNGSTQNGGSESFVKIPKISGGEAMVGLSSDEEDIEKLNRICNE